METFAISGIINAIVAISFGSIVLFKDRHKQINITFFFLSLSVLVWGFAYAKWQLSFDYNEAIFWVRVLAIGSVFMPITFFHWISHVLDIYKKNLFVIRLSYILGFIIVLLSGSKFLIKGLSPKLIFAFWPEPGILYTIYVVVLFIGLVAYSLFLLIKHFYTATQEKRGQIFFIIMGMVFGFGGGLTNFFLWYDINILPYGTFVVAFFPFLLGYALIRHGLFETKVVSTELLTFSLWVFLLIRIFLSEIYSDQLINIILLGFIIFAGVLLILSVNKEVETREKIEKLAKELKQANKKLEEMGEQKSQFLSIASHQFRSPLTAIKGYTSLILEGSYGPVPEKLKEPINNIFASAQNLVIVVEDFLNISRIEQGRMKYDFEKTDVGKLVAGIVEEIRPVAEQRNLKFDFKAPAGETFFSNIDANKIRQVIINIVDNAAKYTPAGWIKVSIDKHDGKILVSVADSGVGISKENIGKLFTMFTRTENAHKVNVMGTGLGLYVAKQMVEAQGGRIWVESPGEGKGSTFFIELKEEV